MSESREHPLRASVIVPAYNCAAALQECIEALLRQTIPASEYEIIVVDDGSTDRTIEVARRTPVQAVSIRHAGPASARNAGAARARGEILVFTDADCVPDPDWLGKMLAPFVDPEVVGVKGAYCTRQTAPAARFAQAEFESRFELLIKLRTIDFVDTYSGAFRRSVFEQVGGFDPSFPVANNEDVDLSYRISALGRRMVFVQDARVYHRHPDTWWKYARLKFSRGYWRMAVYRRFAKKAISDSYTPHSLKLQIVAMVGFLVSLPFAWSSPWFLIGALVFAGLFIGLCVPFYRQASVYMHRPVSLIWGLCVRAVALGLGVGVGLIKSPIKGQRVRSMTWFIVTHMILDVIVLVGSFGLAFWLRAFVLPGWFEQPVVMNEIPWTWATCVGLWFLVLLANRTYSSQRGKSLMDHVINIVRVNLESLAILTMLYFVIHFHYINRTLIGFFMVSNMALLSIEKIVLYAVLRRLRVRGVNIKGVLIVGSRNVVTEPIRRFQSAAEAGFQVVGVLSLDRQEVGGMVLNVPVIGVVDDLEQVLHDHAVDEVFFAIPVMAVSEFEKYLSICNRMGIQGKLVASVFEGMATHVTAEELMGMAFLSFSPRLAKPGELIIKRAIDVIGSVALGVVLSPLMLMVAFMIKMTTKGPVVFKQKRMGLHGRIFTMYKFRTMVEGAEEMRNLDLNIMDGPVFKVAGDPRVTGLGRWLRRFSIDELPQLWNVLLGEMSLVGPRPLPVYEAREIRGELRRRVSMKPGVTGLWQCSGRSLINFDEWMKLDLEYVDRWSLWVDFKIMARTLIVLVKGTGAL